MKATLDPALNLARQLLYRFASLALADPRTGNYNQLVELRNGRLLEEAAISIRDEPAASPDGFARGERPLVELDPHRVLDQLPATPAELNAQYESTFGLLVSNACPPYETEYINGKFTFQRSNAQADVAGFYRAFGLQAASRHPERPDHIVLELEFMARLIALEHAAHEEAANDRVEICRNAQTRFLREHLAWWTPAFCRLVGLQSPGSFYAAACEFLASLIPADRGLLSLPTPSGDPTPDTIERPEECEGCALAQLDG